MRFIFFLVLLCGANFSFAQIITQINFLQPVAKENSDTIYFSPTKNLVWSNFKGIPLERGMAIAETSSGFGFNAGIKTINGRGTLTVNVFCYFNKSTSWVKPDKKSNYALQHEQNHFTISYIATSYFFQQLKKATFTTTNYNRLLNEIYTNSMQKLQQMQNQYDTETRNGINQTKQKIWNVKINDELKLLTKG
jgi:hypothetical protein